MEINNLEKLNINGSNQWVLVRGSNPNKPLLIHIQAGPGLPMISEANTMLKRLHLENDFLVAYWDQRGCGKSFNKKENQGFINFSQLVEDIISCTQLLLTRYKKEKAILSGYSIGASMTLMAAQKKESLYSHLFLTGIDIDIALANQFTLEYALNKADEKHKIKLKKQIPAICRLTITDYRQFQKRAKLISNLGGIIKDSSYNRILVNTFLNMLLCKEYRITDVFKSIKAMQVCQEALIPEMNKLNLFKTIRQISVPVHFIQGIHDGVTPFPLTHKYFEFLQAKIKTFTRFDNSAHMPHYDEPSKFANHIKQKIR